MYNLLFVDDEPLSILAFQSALKQCQSEFQLKATANNGKEALQIVKSQNIDAVITDLKMPNMDGLTLIHELKRLDFSGPILVLSNYSDFDSVRTALTIGAYDYLLKINMNTANLNEQLNKMVKLLQARQQKAAEESHLLASLVQHETNDLLFHCAQWLSDESAGSLSKQLSDKLEKSITFPVWFCLLKLDEEDEVGANISTINDFLSEVLTDVESLIIKSQSRELTILISCQSLKETNSSISKRLGRIERQLGTFFLNTPLLIYYTNPIKLSELHSAYTKCQKRKFASFYTKSKLILASDAEYKKAAFDILQTNLTQAISLAKATNDYHKLQFSLAEFWQTCEAHYINPKRLHDVCYFLLERLELSNYKKQIETLHNFADLRITSI